MVCIAVEGNRIGVVKKDIPWVVVGGSRDGLSRNRTFRVSCALR